MNNPTVDLDNHIPALLFALGAKISLHAQRENARELGLDMCEWRTIQILGLDGVSTINNVADRIAMDRGGTSRAIARLEKRGLVQRHGSTQDRRTSSVELTLIGTGLHEKVASFANARAERLTRELSVDEINALTGILKKLDLEISEMVLTHWRPGP